MLDHYLRGTKDYLLDLVARPLYLVHPLIITLIGLVFGLTAGILLMNQFYFWGFIFWALNRIFDGLDGTIARKNQRQSDLGGYVDILADFIVYALIPIALVIASPAFDAFVSLSFLLATFYVNAASWMFLAGILEKRKQGTKFKGELTTITMPAGLIGGAETVIFYCLFILWPQQLVPLFILMGVLVLFTTGQRLVWATRHLS